MLASTPPEAVLPPVSRSVVSSDHHGSTLCHMLDNVLHGAPSAAICGADCRALCSRSAPSLASSMLGSVGAAARGTGR